jgi:hypothetical protein
MRNTETTRHTGANARAAGRIAFALLLGGAGSAWAVSWTTGANSGNWIYSNPTSAEVGIGITTDPAEKLTIAGGNVLLDNNRFYKGKTTGGTATNLMGLDGTNMLSLYGGKLTVQSNGNVGVGGFVSPISKFYVQGKSTFNGQINVTGGQLLAESGLQSLGAFWAASSTVNGDEVIGGVLTVNGTASNNFFAGNVNVNGTGFSNFSGTNEFWGLTETGELRVWGDLSVSGTKNFVQPHPTDDTKKIVYVAAEAGEALTMARGVSRTENGRATVRLPDHFALVTSEDAPLTVQLTVEGAPALVYVVSKSKEAIEVKMKDSDFSEFRDVTFDYFVQGVRDGFEDHVAIQDVDPAKEGPRLSPKHTRYNERVEKLAKNLRKRHR